MPSKKGETNQIDQIRDIVFGQQMESYENKFQILEKKFEKRFSQLSDSLGQSELELVNQIQIEKNNWADELRSAKKISKDSSTDLEKKLERAEKKFETLLARQYENLKTTIERSKSELAKECSDIRNSLSQQVGNLRKEVQFHVSEIKSSTLSKADFAEALLELSFRFSDESLASGASPKPRATSSRLSN